MTKTIVESDVKTNSNLKDIVNVYVFLPRCTIPLFHNYLSGLQ